MYILNTSQRVVPHGRELPEAAGVGAVQTKGHVEMDDDWVKEESRSHGYETQEEDDDGESN